MASYRPLEEGVANLISDATWIELETFLAPATVKFRARAAGDEDDPVIVKTAQCSFCGSPEHHLNSCELIIELYADKEHSLE